MQAIMFKQDQLLVCGVKLMQGGMISACWEFSLHKIILFFIVQDYMYALYLHQKEFLVLFLELSGMSFFL